MSYGNNSYGSGGGAPSVLAAPEPALTLFTFFLFFSQVAEETPGATAAEEAATAEEGEADTVEEEEEATAEEEGAEATETIEWADWATIFVKSSGTWPPSPSSRRTSTRRTSESSPVPSRRSKLFDEKRRFKSSVEPSPSPSTTSPRPTSPIVRSAPVSSRAFADDLRFSDIMAEIKKAGFANPSAIQSQSWPMALSGRDLVYAPSSLCVALELTTILVPSLQPVPERPSPSLSPP